MICEILIAQIAADWIYLSSFENLMIDILRIAWKLILTNVAVYFHSWKGIEQQLQSYKEV